MRSLATLAGLCLKRSQAIFFGRQGQRFASEATIRSNAAASPADKPKEPKPDDCCQARSDNFLNSIDKILLCDLCTSRTPRESDSSLAVEYDLNVQSGCRKCVWEIYLEDMEKWEQQKVSDSSLSDVLGCEVSVLATPTLRNVQSIYIIPTIMTAEEPPVPVLIIKPTSLPASMQACSGSP
jgi:hypothetical protein